jgi:hypothetical protein
MSWRPAMATGERCSTARSGRGGGSNTIPADREPLSAAAVCDLCLCLWSAACLCMWPYTGCVGVGARQHHCSHLACAERSGRWAHSSATTATCAAGPGGTWAVCGSTTAVTWCVLSAAVCGRTAAPLRPLGRRYLGGMWAHGSTVLQPPPGVCSAQRHVGAQQRHYSSSRHCGHLRSAAQTDQWVENYSILRASARPVHIT